MTTNYDTQKIILNLKADLKKTKQERPTTENVSFIRWLKSKLAFYSSEHYQEYKKTNGDSQ